MGAVSVHGGKYSPSESDPNHSVSGAQILGAGNAWNDR